MKILVFHQPYPMGNYKLNEVIAHELKERLDGAEVVLLQQLNGLKPDEEYVQQILDYDPDIVYYEMLDHETFKIVEKLENSLRVLLMASGGILSNMEDIVEYKGSWYDVIYTNSIKMSDLLNRRGAVNKFFQFYPSVIGFNSTTNPSPEFKKVGLYEHDAVFLGMGHHRRTSSEYQLERKLFFDEGLPFSFGLYGVGWEGHSSYRGLLPPNAIGNLYASAKSAFAMIATGQRKAGMINNRYVEIAAAMCPIISPNYSDFDWFGLDKFITFAPTRNAVIQLVKNFSKGKDDDYRLIKCREFMRGKTEDFFENLINLIDEN
jgi:hypothetical protein